MIAAGRVASAFLLAIAGLSATARAEGRMPPAMTLPWQRTPLSEEHGLRLTFGLGGALSGLSTSPRFALPLEVTVVPTAAFNASAGVVFSSLGVADAYGELGSYFGVSLGLGLGYGRRETSRGVASDPVGHVFVGVPIPLNDAFHRQWFNYVVPYYRPSWDLRTKDAVHELGVMIKMSYSIVTGPSGFTD